jgi:hypothetical protein
MRLMSNLEALDIWQVTVGPPPDWTAERRSA